jgi:hypothetical protein
MDVLVLKPFHYLRQYDFSLGEEGVNASVVCCCCCCCAIYHNPYPWLAFAQGLGNAVLIARKGAPFLKRWRAEYCRHFDSSHWNHYSVRRANCDVYFFFLKTPFKVKLPHRIYRMFRNEAKVLPYYAFYMPLWDTAGLRELYFNTSRGIHCHLVGPSDSILMCGCIAMETENHIAIHLWSEKVISVAL